MNVLLPTSLDEACAMMARPSVAGAPVASVSRPIPMAGATDLLVHWPSHLEAHDKTYLDLSKVAELRASQWTSDALTLGALATYWDAMHDAQIAGEFPLLIEAARQVGAVQIQSRGTWAGNIANGSPAADGVPVLMAYDAEVELASASGRRRVALSAFYTGYRRSVRREDELITAIVLPRRTYDLCMFEKVGARRAQAITKVGLAVTRRAGGGAGAWRVVANSVAPTVRRCPSIEAMLEAGVSVRSPDDFAAAVGADVSPIDDIRSTAEYRRTVLCRLLYFGLRGKCDGVK